jgi:hypothetical protein
MFLGALALLVAAMLTYAGPLERQPMPAGSLRDRAIAAVQSRPAPSLTPWTIDRIAGTATSGIGALAAILGVVGLVRREDRRTAIAAMGLGTAAMAFHMLVFALSLIIVLLIVAAVLSTGL